MKTPPTTNPRRTFLKKIGLFLILPPATTYSRIWKCKAGLVLPLTTKSGYIFTLNDFREFAKSYSELRWDRIMSSEEAFQKWVVSPFK